MVKGPGNQKANLGPFSITSGFERTFGADDSCSASQQFGLEEKMQTSSGMAAPLQCAAAQSRPNIALRANAELFFRAQVCLRGIIIWPT